MVGGSEGNQGSAVLCGAYVPEWWRGRAGPAQAQGRSTVEPVVSLASSARWASAASASG